MQSLWNSKLNPFVHIECCTIYAAEMFGMHADLIQVISGVLNLLKCSCMLHSQAPDHIQIFIALPTYLHRAEALQNQGLLGKQPTQA